MQFLSSMDANTMSNISMIAMLVIMFAVMYFLLYRPQKKQQKKDAEMRNSLEIGDEVTTIGGIVGRVIALKEDTFVLETGSDRTKIRFRRAAVQAVTKLDMEAPAQK
ncbi:MAG TPA: preprotein translocase subunit YajC [Candidatus Fournierella pullicola]|uniref:Preprotein translocase subunit YajC n=1 Tax=Candidatus Allofournierella pullicola TaxID=2838596 RepID=A0A9D1V3H1_9FIRM|nr:preprotein translocase subunit YajC [Candidatus Fournierella pullicola]